MGSKIETVAYERDFMSPITTIATAIICSLFTFLLTYFLTNAASAEKIKKIVRDEIQTHEQIKHQEVVRTFVEGEIEKHEQRCPAASNFMAIERGLSFLIAKNGGNPQQIMR